MKYPKKVVISGINAFFQYSAGHYGHYHAEDGGELFLHHNCKLIKRCKKWK